MPLPLPLPLLFFFWFICLFILFTTCYRLSFLSEFLYKLDGLELGTHLKKGQLMKQELFKEARFFGWQADLHFRSSVCACLAQSRALQQIVPDELPEKICEALPQLFPSMVGLCRALESVDHTLLCGAASSGLIQADHEAKLNECLTSGPRALIQTWTAGIILEKQSEFEGALCKTKFPEQHRNKFLPPGLSEEDLNKYADTDTDILGCLGDHLALLHGSLDDRQMQRHVLVEACVSSMQVWAAKLITSMSSLPAVDHNITLKVLSIDPSMYAAIKAMSAELKKADEIVKLMVDTGGQEAMASILAEAKAFVQQKQQSFEDRLAKLVAAGTAMAKQHTPNWRAFVVETPDPNKIKNDFIESKCIQNLRSIYPVLSQLGKDLDAADADLELRLKVKIKDALELFNAAAAEVKLAIGVEHVCTVIFVLGPAAKGQKAKAGLLRELKVKLSRAQLTGLIPAELILQAQGI
jgi:hypothetical protein